MNFCRWLFAAFALILRPVPSRRMRCASARFTTTTPAPNRRSHRGFGARGHRPHRLAGRAVQRQRRRHLRHRRAPRRRPRHLRHARRAWYSTMPANGIQNGAPDGIALVDAPARWSNSCPTKGYSRRPMARRTASVPWTSASRRTARGRSGESLARNARRHVGGRRPALSAPATTTAKQPPTPKSLASRSLRHGDDHVGGTSRLTATAFDVVAQAIPASRSPGPAAIRTSPP